MSQSDEKRRALDQLHSKIHAFCRSELESNQVKAAAGDQEAHSRAVSISAMLHALELTKGALLRDGSVVVHGDLATARRVIVRVSEPSLALREEAIALSRLPANTPKEISAKQAKAEELTGRKLVDVFTENAALSTRLGEGHAVITAPSPTTQDVGKTDDEDREANAHRYVITIKDIRYYSRSELAVALLFDYPDPRIAEKLLKRIARTPRVRAAIGEVVVVDGELLETRQTTDSVVAFPADPHRRFPMAEMSLNQKLNLDEAATRALVAVPESIRVRFIAADGELARSKSIAPSLWTPSGAALTPLFTTFADPDSTPEEHPLTLSQLAFLTELQTRNLSFVVTGVVGLRLHAYAAGVAVPEWFSSRRYPTMELALEPGLSNLRQGFAALHDLVEKGVIEPYVHPIPTDVPFDGRTANIVLLNSETSDVLQRAVMVSYGAKEIDSYPRNPVANILAVVGALEVPIARTFEAEASARKKIEVAFNTDDVGPAGLLVLDELRRLVGAIDRAHKTLSVLPRGRAHVPPSPSRLRFPRKAPDSGTS